MRSAQRQEWVRRLASETDNAKAGQERLTDSMPAAVDAGAGAAGPNGGQAMRAPPAIRQRDLRSGPIRAADTRSRAIASSPGRTGTTTMSLPNGRTSALPSPSRTP